MIFNHLGGEVLRQVGVPVRITRGHKQHDRNMAFELFQFSKHTVRKTVQ